MTITDPSLPQQQCHWPASLACLRIFYSGGNHPSLLTSIQIKLQTAWNSSMKVEISFNFILWVTEEPEAVSEPSAGSLLPDGPAFYGFYGHAWDLYGTHLSAWNQAPSESNHMACSQLCSSLLTTFDSSPCKSPIALIIYFILATSKVF